MSQKLIIRKDKENNWFRVFLPSGEEVSDLMQVKIVKDSFEDNKENRIIATFEAIVKIGEDI